MDDWINSAAEVAGRLGTLVAYFIIILMAARRTFAHWKFVFIASLVFALSLFLGRIFLFYDVLSISFSEQQVALSVLALVVSILSMIRLNKQPSSILGNVFSVVYGLSLGMQQNWLEGLFSKKLNFVDLLAESGLTSIAFLVLFFLVILLKQLLNSAFGTAPRDIVLVVAGATLGISIFTIFAVA